MNEDLADGLKRRFETIEKNKYAGNRTLSFLEYFSFIINNSLLLDITKNLLKKSEYISDEMLEYILIVSQQNNNSSLLDSKVPRIRIFFKEVIKSLNEKKNIKFTNEDIIELEKDRKRKIWGLKDETFLNDFTVFHNKILDNLSGTRPKTSLICLSSNISKCYKPRGASNRLDYLEILIRKNGEPVSAKILAKKLKVGVNYRVVVSNELKNINEIIKNKLSLKNEVILGKDGYRLNTADYEFSSS